MERSSQHGGVEANISSNHANGATIMPAAAAPDRTIISSTTRALVTADPSSASSASKSSERSAVVLALFGPSVGPCVGDFSTTYNRVNGRLYAATRAILFYSNLFGFERRLCLQLSDIESIEAFRSTSIRINMVDCEDHVFRKFVHRDEVLQVLKELYEHESSSHQHLSSSSEIQTTNTTTTRFLPIATDLDTGAPIRRTNHTEMDNQQYADEYNHRYHDASTTTPRPRFASDLSHPPNDSHEAAARQQQQESLRPRSQSVPSMKRLLSLQEKASSKLQNMDNSITSRTRKFRRSISLRSPANNSKVAASSAGEVPTTPTADTAVEAQVLAGSHEDDYDDMDSTNKSSSASSELSGPSAPPGFNMNHAWAAAKESYSEVALKNTVLACSLEAFMDMFISNEASFPIARYQKEHIHDKHLSYSKWKKRTSTIPEQATLAIFPPIFDREISFVHPLNNTVGPSQAKTNRRQCFQRFGALGATLQNITNVEGVPGAECFRVEDRWVIESVGDTSIKLSVYFQIPFSKRTMFKSIIQKNIKAETKKWFHGYVKFLHHALQEDDKKEDRGLSSRSNAPPSSSLASAEGSETEATPTSSSESRNKHTSSLIGGPRRSPLPSLIVWLAVLLVLCGMVLQLFQLRQSVHSLHDQLITIREENKELRTMMQLIIDNKN